MWKRLTHPNIVPFLGITLEPLQLISAWVSGEELRDYISNHPDTDRLDLAGVPLPLVSDYAYALPSYVVSLTASITSTPAIWFTGSSRG